MKFEFETGEIIEVFDEGIAKLLRVDKRYKEVGAKKDTTSKTKGNTKKDTTPKGDDPDGEVQE